jgi:hypothetical protein
MVELGFSVNVWLRLGHGVIYVNSKPWHFIIINVLQFQYAIQHGQEVSEKNLSLTL